MKLERHTKPGDMWEWLRRNLPPSLRAQEIHIGYGVIQAIYQSGYSRPWTDRFFGREGAAIAAVRGTTIEIYRPEYLSDFQDLARSWEISTGYEVTLRYWESPKPERAA